MPHDLRLLIVDPQNDFCATDAATRHPSHHPALPVNGADADMRRLALAIDTLGPRLDHIAITLDSHAVRDIAHPTFWQTATGGEVAPFTPISADDLAAGHFRTRDPADLPRARRYVAALAIRAYSVKNTPYVYCSSSAIRADIEVKPIVPRGNCARGLRPVPT